MNQLLRIPPTKPYNGVTVILSQPSRNDLKLGYLISGHAGIEFNNALNECNTSRWACDIRTSDNEEPLLKDTTGILLLGEPALHKVAPIYNEYKLTELRGTPLNIQRYSGLPSLCSFTPQDCCDQVDHEKRLNPLLLETEDTRDDKESDDDAKSRHGATQRKNYLFWLRSDVRKLFHKLKGGEIYDSTIYTVRIYPRASELINTLRGYSGTDLFFDIETDSERNITVIGFSFGTNNTVWSFPILDYNYHLYYGRDTYNILRALVYALSRNRVVIHNCMFDLFVLLFKYRLLISDNIYDTMLAQKRIFTGIEKSLGHCLSYYPEIWEAYHKDEGIFEPKNAHQERQLIEYNAKDVIALRLIKAAQDKHSSGDTGLIDSINQANESPYAFLISTLTGILVDKEGIAQQMNKNDRMMDQLMRIARILAGPLVDFKKLSSQEIVNYFHHALGYPIVGTSKKTGGPSLDATNLLKLKLKYPLNAMIDVCLKYREIKTMSGHLKATALRGWHE